MNTILERSCHDSLLSREKQILTFQNVSNNSDSRRWGRKNSSVSGNRKKSASSSNRRSSVGARALTVPAILVDDTRVALDEPSKKDTKSKRLPKKGLNVRTATGHQKDATLPKKPTHLPKLSPKKRSGSPSSRRKRKGTTVTSKEPPGNVDSKLFVTTSTMSESTLSTSPSVSRIRDSQPSNTSFSKHLQASTDEKPKILFGGTWRRSKKSSDTKNAGGDKINLCLLSPTHDEVAKKLNELNFEFPLFEAKDKRIVTAFEMLKTGVRYDNTFITALGYFLRKLKTEDELTIRIFLENICEPILTNAELLVRLPRLLPKTKAKKPLAFFAIERAILTVGDPTLYTRETLILSGGNRFVSPLDRTENKSPDMTDREDTNASTAVAPDDADENLNHDDPLDDGNQNPDEDDQERNQSEEEADELKILHEPKIIVSRRRGKPPLADDEMESPPVTRQDSGTGPLWWGQARTFKNLGKSIKRAIALRKSQENPKSRFMWLTMSLLHGPIADTSTNEEEMLMNNTYTMLKLLSSMEDEAVEDGEGGASTPADGLPTVDEETEAEYDKKSFLEKRLQAEYINKADTWDLQSTSEESESEESEESEDEYEVGEECVVRRHAKHEGKELRRVKRKKKTMEGEEEEEEEEEVESEERDDFYVDKDGNVVRRHRRVRDEEDDNRERRRRRDILKQDSRHLGGKISERKKKTRGVTDEDYQAKSIDAMGRKLKGKRKKGKKTFGEGIYYALDTDFEYNRKDDLDQKHFDGKVLHEEPGISVEKYLLRYEISYLFEMMLTQLIAYQPEKPFDFLLDLVRDMKQKVDTGRRVTAPELTRFTNELTWAPRQMSQLHRQTKLPNISS